MKCDIYNGKPVLQYLTNIFLNLTEENGEHLEYLELSDPYFDFLFKNKTKQDFPNLKEWVLKCVAIKTLGGQMTSIVKDPHFLKFVSCVAILTPEMRLENSVSRTPSH